jgi:ribosomal subunit interface protein
VAAVAAAERLITIHVHPDVEVTDALRVHVERRLGLALGRFGDRIGRVRVRFSEAEAKAGDGHKRCQIQIGLRPLSVDVVDCDADLFAADNTAVARASRSVARALERERG